MRATLGFSISAMLISGLLLSSCRPLETELQAPRQPGVFVLRYWPAVDRCEPQDMSVLLTVAEFAKARPDVAVETYLPRGQIVESLYRHPIPGKVMRTRGASKRPLPRIQAWSSQGQLVLDRSIPQYGDQADLVKKELFSALTL